MNGILTNLKFVYFENRVSVLKLYVQGKLRVDLVFPCIVVDRDAFADKINFKVLRADNVFSFFTCLPKKIVHHGGTLLENAEDFSVIRTRAILIF
jgi:hypothetical protein